jgi:translocator protein
VATESLGAQAPRRWGTLVLWLLAVLAVGWIGSIVTLPKIPTWYASLAKPWFTPPDWVFGPVWTTLYVLMAIAAWRVSRVPRALRPPGTMAIFVSQLALNAIWSPVFFGLEALRLALAVIISLFAAIVATLVAFGRVDRCAALLMAPYLAWVGYAAVLNAAIDALN